MKISEEFIEKLREEVRKQNLKTDLNRLIIITRLM